MDWTGSKSDSKTSSFLSVLLSSVLLSHFCLPMDKTLSLITAGHAICGNTRHGDVRRQVWSSPKMLDYGAYNGLQQHKYLPVTSDMLLTSPHNLSQRNCQWHSSCEHDLWMCTGWGLPLRPHALDTPTLLKVLFKMHSSFLDCCCLLSYL